MSLGVAAMSASEIRPHAPTPTSLPGLVASLTKKGLASANGESVALTPAGFAAYGLQTVVGAYGGSIDVETLGFAMRVERAASV